MFEEVKVEIDLQENRYLGIDLNPEFIGLSIKEGDKILDTHLGSGSIAIACHNLGFDLTACELDKEYYDKAMKRIQEHKQQIRMF